MSCRCARPGSRNAYLQRTFATAIQDNGEVLITVKDAMGHASVTTTQQDDRRGEARLRSAGDRLNLTDV